MKRPIIRETKTERNVAVVMGDLLHRLSKATAQKKKKKKKKN